MVMIVVIVVMIVVAMVTHVMGSALRRGGRGRRFRAGGGGEPGDKDGESKEGFHRLVCCRDFVAC